MTEKIEAALRVCETCDIKHYDNCPSCFGFGVRAHLCVHTQFNGAPVPISAGEAVEVRSVYGAWAPCPTCKSTPDRGLAA